MGTAKNPIKNDRTPGGSSSGEAILIYSKCSPLGFGTDDLGSHRLPCLFHGVYGFNFSENRVTKLSSTSIESDKKLKDFLWSTQMGVIARDTRDIELVTKCLIEHDGMYEKDKSLKKLDWDYSGIISTQSNLIDKSVKSLDLDK